MSIYEDPDYAGHEFVGFYTDEAAGLKAIIAIHKKMKGRAGGGVRMYPYARSSSALNDALRLSKAMTYKMALAGLPMGGGKSVIIGDPKRDKSEAMFDAFGRAVASLNDRYICGEDVGTTPQDMAVIRRHTDCVIGLPDTTGDTSPATGYGIFHAMLGAVEHVTGHARLRGMTVAVQGAGNVGRYLMKHLAAAGARILAADIDQEAVARVAREFGAEPVPPEDILGAEVDILAPCALGAVLNDESIPRIRAKIVCGGANNQLAEARHGRVLHERGILYVPDYLANAGGAIVGTGEYFKRDPAETDHMIEAIGETCRRILDRARQDGIPASRAADRIAEEIIEASD